MKIKIIKILSPFIIVTLFSCSSSSGGNPEITQRIDEPAGRNCPNAGSVLLRGVDRDGDGLLESDNEIEGATFECNASNWSAEVKVNKLSANASFQNMLVEPNGDRIIFYRQIDPQDMNNKDYMDYYTSSTDGTVTSIVPYGDAFKKFSMDMSGHAIAVWPQEENQLGSVWASRYSKALGWQTPEKIAQSNVTHLTAFSQIPEVDVVMLDELDSAIAISKYSAAGGWMVHANQFTTGGNWLSPESLETITTYTPSSMPAIAKDPNGNVFAIWARAGRIFVDRYRYLVGWQGAIAIDNSPNGIPTSDTNISVSRNGIAFAQWSENIFEESEHWGAFYRPGTGWGEAFKININAKYIDLPSTFNNNDELLLSWVENDADIWKVWISKLADETSIEHTAIYEYETTNRLDQLYNLKIAADNVGNIAVVWPRRNYYWSSFYDADANVWSRPEVISGDGADRQKFTLKMYGNGNAIICWKQTDLTNINGFIDNIWYRELKIQ